MTRRARRVPLDARDRVHAYLSLRHGVPPLDIGNRALEAGVVGARPAVPGGVLNMHLLVMAIQQSMLSGRGQLVPRRVEAEPHAAAERLHQMDEVVTDVLASAPRPAPARAH